MAYANTVYFRHLLIASYWAPIRYTLGSLIEYGGAVMKKLLAFLLLAFPSVGAYANHAWNDYHWASMSKPFTLQIVDSMTADWDYPLNEAISQWSQSTKVMFAITSFDDKAKTREHCRMKTGQIRMCNDAYGITGWLGQTVLGFDSSGHADKARVRINESYSQYFTFEKKNYLLCHELGHTLGLWHTSEDGSSQMTCMDLSNDPITQTPNNHDFEELEIIYGHDDTYNSYDDGSGKGSGGKPGGKPPKANSGELISRGIRHEVWMAPREDGGHWIYHVLLAPAE